jgi:hypothetical protein
MVTIEDNRHIEHTFGGLYIGDCFMHEGELYMITEDAIEEENVSDDYYESDVMNALNLNNGFLKRFNDGDLVELVDVTITIS